MDPDKKIFFSRMTICFCTAVILILGTTSESYGQKRPYPKLKMPDNVERSKITIWSRGVALDGDIYRPKNIGKDEKIPAVVLSHGIGGDKLTAERYAAKFAASGMITLTFSHTGWGKSQGRLIAVGELPEPDENNEMTVKVRVIRELIDPIEWVESFRSAIDYIEGEPNVDSERIGAWGTSFGGGTAFYATAIDDRIKALTIQVGGVFNAPGPMKKKGQQRAVQIARGDFDSVPQNKVDEMPMPGLAGTPHFARMAQFLVGDMSDRINVPTLIIDGENEQMFHLSQSGSVAHKKLKARGVETYYEVLPGVDHYGIYFEGYDRGSKLQHDWFVKHLKK